MITLAKGQQPLSSMTRIPRQRRACECQCFCAHASHVCASAWRVPVCSQFPHWHACRHPCKCTLSQSWMCYAVQGIPTVAVVLWVWPTLSSFVPWWKEHQEGSVRLLVCMCMHHTARFGPLEQQASQGLVLWCVSAFLACSAGRSAACSPHTLSKMPHELLAHLEGAMHESWSEIWGSRGGHCCTHSLSGSNNGEFPNWTPPLS